MVIMASSDYLWTSHRGYSQVARPDGEYLHWISDITEEIPIRMTTTGPGSIPPVSLYQLLAENARAAESKVALRVQRNKKWVSYTWGMVHSQSLQVARALVHLQVPERTCVNIIGFNSPEWLLAFTGSITANCVSVGVYTTNQTDACFYVANHSGMQVLFAQNETHIKKYLPVLDKLPSLKAVVCWLPSAEFQTLRQGHSNFYTWEEFLRLGTPADDPMPRTANISPASPCTIVYTSGTTGPPKGVMLSHDNYIWTAKSLTKLEAFEEDERIVSYLPLSHSAAQYFDIFIPISIRAIITYADEKALQGSLADTLKFAQPTAFLGVPRVYEKMEEAIRVIASKTGGLKRRIALWAKGLGYKGTMAALKKEGMPWGYCLANSLVLSKVKQALGFDKTKFFFVGAAPISKSTLEFFAALNIPIFNVFGMSESSAPTTINHTAKNNLWSAGYAAPGTDLCIFDPKNKPLPAGTRGEICFRGRNKFLGYFKSPKETRETIDSQGFIHSGDEGYLDEHGFLFITGRFKELIITAGGENIPPVLIEDQIKAETKLISNVMLVGDARKYLAALVTLRSVISPEGVPSDQLTPEAISILQAAGITATTVSAAIADSKVHALVGKAIATANKVATSQAQYVRKWKLIGRDFSIPGGELTPTMKLKRKVVQEMYKAEIEALYSEAKL